jgi:PPOX class probable FMN-dependent enzyme
MPRIETHDTQRRIYKEPIGRAVVKAIPRLDRHCRRFIELSPFLVIASGDGKGAMDASPRGEEPGFVQVLDDRTLAIPDRPGNNRLDTFTNILVNPAVGLIFFIPGVEETLRINGTAEIRDDEALVARFEVGGKRPATVLVVGLGEAYLHCAKALMRSRLWSADVRVGRSVLPSMGQMLKDQIGLAEEPESQEVMCERYSDQLY